MGIVCINTVGHFDFVTDLAHLDYNRFGSK